MNDEHTATIQKLLNAGGPVAIALTGLLLEYSDYKGRALAADNALDALMAENKRLKAAVWTCPDCAFTFDASHENTDDSGHSCPVCENERLRAVAEAARHVDHEMTCKPSDRSQPCWCGHEALELALAALDRQEQT